MPRVSPKNHGGGGVASSTPLLYRPNARFPPHPSAAVLRASQNRRAGGHSFAIVLCISTSPSARGREGYTARYSCGFHGCGGRSVARWVGRSGQPREARTFVDIRLTIRSALSRLTIMVNRVDGPPAQSVRLGGSSWLAIVASVLLLGALWGTWWWVKWGGEPGTVRDRTEIMTYLIFAAAATVVILPGLLLHVRKIRVLASRGVTTEGRVVKVSMFSKHGLAPTTIVYTVGGREYRIRRDLPRVGSTVTILYDPEMPKRFAILH